MRRQMDIALTDDDVAIVNGDFFMTESTREHQRQLLLNEKGDFKENPTVCVGAFSYLMNDSMEELAAEVSRQFARDGMDGITSKLLPNGQIQVDGYYR